MATLDISAISLREAERAFLVGGSGSGKSTLSLPLILDFDSRYKARAGETLIEDSKPRFRAEWLLDGRRAASLYKAWDHGVMVPGSVLVRTPRDIEQARRLGFRIFIAQGAGVRNVPRLLACADWFVEHHKKNRPQLLVVDEVLDFYHSNGAPRGSNDPITRAVRAGRERGIATLICSQRTKGIPPAIMEELRKLYAFRMDSLKDADRFAEMSCPVRPYDPREGRTEFDLPDEDWLFVYWTKQERRRVWGPYRLAKEAIPA